MTLNFETILLFVLTVSSLAILWALIEILKCLDKDDPDINSKKNEAVGGDYSPQNRAETPKATIFEWQPPKSETELLAEKVIKEINNK